MKIAQEIEKVLNAIGLTAASVIIGLIGSTIAQIRGEKKPLWKRFFSWISGAVGAAFLGPVVAHFLHANQEHLKYGIVFFVGLFAKDLSDFVVLTIQFASKNQALLLSIKNRFKKQ